MNARRQAPTVWSRGPTTRTRMTPQQMGMGQCGDQPNRARPHAAASSTPGCPDQTRLVAAVPARLDFSRQLRRQIDVGSTVPELRGVDLGARETPRATRCAATLCRYLDHAGCVRSSSPIRRVCIGRSAIP